MSSHGVARASRSAISVVRAWNTSALTFSGGHPITVAISAWPRSPSSCRTSAPRWSSGRPREVGHELAQVGAAADVVGQAVERDLDVVGRHRGRAAGREQREAAVAGDREQPRADRVRHPAVEQRPVRAQERLLERVLAVLAVADHVPAEREQRRVVAVVERLEGGDVAARHERGEALVGETAEPAVPRSCVQHTEDDPATRLIPTATLSPIRSVARYDPQSDAQVGRMRPTARPPRGSSRTDANQEGEPHVHQARGRRRARRHRRARDRGRPRRGGCRPSTATPAARPGSRTRPASTAAPSTSTATRAATSSTCRPAGCPPRPSC